LRFASIDIGSHTLRLLVAQEESGGQVFPLHVGRRITRLARDFSQGGNLKAESMAESLAVLGEFSALLRRYHVEAVVCGATGVLRRAGNAGEFLQRVAEANGISPVILSEEEEAFYSAKGVLSGLSSGGRHVLSFDLGGGSTELMLIDPSHTRSLWSTSVFIGAATVTERFLPGDPPAPSAVVNAREAVCEALYPALAELRTALKDEHLPPPELLVVGTAGTATTLAAMFLEMSVYDPSRVNGLLLPKTWLAQIVTLLEQASLVERQKLAGLEKGREGIILGGALIVEELLHSLEQEQLIVVDSGLLEGLVLALIEKAHGWPERLASPLSFRWQAREEQVALGS